MMAGWNHSEGYIFASTALPHNTAAQFQHYLPLQFGNKTTESPSNPALYPANTHAQANASAIDLASDLGICEPTWEDATTQLKTGQPVHVYYFTYTSAFSPIAIHTAELPFVFGSLYPTSGFQGPPRKATAADYVLSQMMQAYWINFAASEDGDPNGEGLPHWPAYEGGGGRILGLGREIGVVEYDLSRFEFIESFRTDGVFPTSWLSINVTTAARH